MINKNSCIITTILIFLVFILYDYKQLDQQIITNFQKTIIIGICLGYLLYTGYNYLIVYNKIQLNKSTDNVEDFENKLKNKRVSFNDVIDVLNFSVENPWHSRDDIVDNSTDIIMDNLLNDQQNSQPKKFIPITEVDKDKLFDELEEEIAIKYKTLETDVTVPLNPTILRSTNDTKNSDINPAINPNIYSNANIPDGVTIWEHYDNMTTNNYKQFNSLENMQPKEITNAFRLDNNNTYGMTNFDTYSLN